MKRLEIQAFYLPPYAPMWCRSNHLKFQPFLDILSTSIFVLDDKCCIDYLNESAESLIAESLTRVRGQQIDQLIELADSGEGQSSMVQACCKAISDGIQVRLHGVEVVVPATRSARMMDCFVHYCSIDEKDYAVVELLDQGSKKVVGDSGKIASGHNVIRGLAHEIRNPLGGIRGAAQLLGNEITSPELAQYTDLIVSEADRLARLVSQMQASTRVRGKRRLNIHTILEHVRSLVESESAPLVSIQTDYDPSLPEVDVDSDQLTQAFLNISRNALEAAEAGSGRAVVILRSRIDRQALPDQGIHQVIRVDVEDNGIGVDDAIAEHIFDPMVSGKSHGTGLGLSITAEIIRNHGGLILMESEPGRTVFSVFLGIGSNSSE